MATEKKETVTMDAEAMIAENTKNGTKIKYNDRVKLKVVKDTNFYKAGQVINPHRVIAEQLVKDKIAEIIK
jgi:hypothetical protein